MQERPFRVLGVQQIAVGALDKTGLGKLYVELFGLERTGNYRNERENVDEDIVRIGKGPLAIEIDLMQPIDPEKSPKVHVPQLNHFGLWVDDLRAAVEWLGAQGVRFTPGGIRRGAGGHDVCFIHPKGNDESPVGGQGTLIELVQAPPEVIAALGSRRVAAPSRRRDGPPQVFESIEHFPFAGLVFDIGPVDRGNARETFEIDAIFGAGGDELQDQQVLGSCHTRPGLGRPCARDDQELKCRLGHLQLDHDRSIRGRESSKIGSRRLVCSVLDGDVKAGRGEDVVQPFQVPAAGHDRHVYVRGEARLQPGVHCVATDHGVLDAGSREELGDERQLFGQWAPILGKDRVVALGRRTATDRLLAR